MGEIGPIGALVFEALWVTADDGGTAGCDPDVLKGSMFHQWSMINIGDIQKALCQLSLLGRISFFKGGDALYCQIVHWQRHQSVHRPSKFRHSNQCAKFGKPFEPTVPDWCGTGDAQDQEPPPPRLLESQTPRLLETQLHGGASRRSGTDKGTDSGAPTFSELMGLVRKHLYVPDGKPPAGWDESRDGSILKQLLKLHGPNDVAIAIEGVALVRDFPGVYADAVNWRDQGHRSTLPPHAKATLKVLYGSKSGVLPMFTIATNAYWKRANARSHAKAMQSPEPIADVVRRVMPETR